MVVYNVPAGEAAALIGVARKTLENWRSADRRVVSWVKRDGRIFYNREELEAYAASGVRYG